MLLKVMNDESRQVFHCKRYAAAIGYDLHF